MILSARCLRSSMFIGNQEFLLAPERCCPPIPAPAVRWVGSTKQVLMARARCRIQGFFPAFSCFHLDRILLLADGSGLQHYLITTYLWQSHNILFHQGKKPFAGGWTCEWEVVMSCFSSAQGLCKRRWSVQPAAFSCTDGSLRGAGMGRAIPSSVWWDKVSCLRMEVTNHHPCITQHFMGVVVCSHLFAEPSLLPDFATPDADGFRAWKKSLFASVFSVRNCDLARKSRAIKAWLSWHHNHCLLNSPCKAAFCKQTTPLQAVKCLPGVKAPREQ